MSLIPYAISNTLFIKRKYSEIEDTIRTPFQRDRDRIIHSKYFRRLEYKTQVFENSFGDHYRTRLTHSLEVSQISRVVARALNLNEDLTETLALSHDLGHPPFGHAGEKALHQIMKEKGGFNHNKHTLRVVEVLEQTYAQFDGLNLTKGTLLGLQKHNKIVEGYSHSLEAQIVDQCDELAYIRHDIEDGLESKLITLTQLESVPLWQKVFSKVNKEPSIKTIKQRVKLALISLANLMVRDLIDVTKENLQKFKVKTLDDVIYFHKNHPNEGTSTNTLVKYSDGMKQDIVQCKKFLFNEFYSHPDIIFMNIQANTIIQRIFDFIKAHPLLLPQEYKSRITEKHTLEYSIVDFIAGMTDRYAISWNQKALDIFNS